MIARMSGAQEEGRDATDEGHEGCCKPVSKLGLAASLLQLQAIATRKILDYHIS